MPRKPGTGCITCRIRRVKCDEQRPECRRCILSKRKCDGYMPNASSITRRQLAEVSRCQDHIEPVQLAISQTPQHQSRNHHPHRSSPLAVTYLFDVFRHSTAPNTAMFFPSEFWSRALLQLAHSEPAAWHAVLALGALHRRWELDYSDRAKHDSIDRGALTLQAIESQGYAVSLAREVKDAPTMLALSLALVSIANLMGNWNEASMHIKAGMNLLDHAGDSELAKRSAEALTRQDLLALTLSDSSAPYPCKDFIWFTAADREMRAADGITSHMQASNTLLRILRRLMLFDEALANEVLWQHQEGPEARQLALDLYKWEADMMRFEHVTLKNQDWALMMRAYHAFMRLLLQVGYHGPETRYDPYVALFDRVVACAELLTSPKGTRVSLELGIIVPLFVVAVRCRHPVLRRKAAQIMRNLKSQEGRWNSDGAAVAAEKIIAVEEQTGEYLPDGKEGNKWSQHALEPPSIKDIMDVPWDSWATGNIKIPTRVSWDNVEVVPEAHRVHDTVIMVSMEKRQIEFTMMMCSGDDLGTYGDARQDVLYF